MHNPVSCRKTPLLKRKENAFVPKEGSQLLNIQEVKYVGTNREKKIERERERHTRWTERRGQRFFYVKMKEKKKNM